MVKNLSCVSCGSLKRFPHTFTTAMYLLLFLLKCTFERSHSQFFATNVLFIGSVGDLK